MTILLDDPRGGPDEPGILDFMEVCSQFYPADGGPITVERQRRCYDNLCAHFYAGRPKGMIVRDLTCSGPTGDIALRQYVPATLIGNGCVIYMHGGGFVLGSLDSHDDICCGIAHDAGVMVIAIDYRLAPEHTFPAAFDDCVAAIDWVFDNSSGLGVDARRILLAGDSAGGNLAAATCLARRDLGQKMPAGQVLIYPTFGGDKTRGSYVSRRDAPGLTVSDMIEYERLYLGSHAGKNQDSKFYAPLRETNYGGLPSAFLVACEWDPLRDDSFEYADRLSNAGVPAEVRHEPELIHACLRARHTSPAANAMFQSVVDEIIKMSE